MNSESSWGTKLQDNRKNSFKEILFTGVGASIFVISILCFRYLVHKKIDKLRKNRRAKEFEDFTDYCNEESLEPEYIYDSDYESDEEEVLESVIQLEEESRQFEELKRKVKKQLETKDDKSPKKDKKIKEDSIDEKIFGNISLSEFPLLNKIRKAKGITNTEDLIKAALKEMRQ